MRRQMTQRLIVLGLTMLLAFNPLSIVAAPKITFSVSDAVLAEDEAYVREGLVLATRFIDQTFGSVLQHDLVVNIRETSHPTNPGIIAFASSDFLVIFSGSPMWDTFSPAIRVQILIHEFVHVYQNDMLGEYEDASPMWLIEGMAEYVSYAAIESIGLVRPQAAVDYQSWTVRRDWEDVPLLHDIEDVEAYQSATGPVYGLSFLAIDRLMDDGSLDRLVKYVNEVNSGVKWKEAFLDSFGLKLEDFYDRFELWLRDDMIAPARIPESMRAISGVDRESDVNIIASPDFAVAGGQIVILAKTEPTTNCQFRLSDSDGDRLSTMNTVSDASGLVFWLKSLSRSLKKDQIRVTADCGDDPDFVEVPVFQ